MSIVFIDKNISYF